jgi:hypothetical protein
VNRACPPCHHDCGQGNARHCPAHSLNTRRYSRTLAEAFGPHTSRHITEPEGRAHPAEVVMYVVIAPAVVALLVAIAFGWIA